jgi:streptogramin lyase
VDFTNKKALGRIVGNSIAMMSSRDGPAFELSSLRGAIWYTTNSGYLGQRTSSGAVRDFAVPGGKVYSLRADRGGLWVGSAGYGTRGLLRVDSKHRVRAFAAPPRPGLARRRSLPTRAAISGSRLTEAARRTSRAAPPTGASPRIHCPAAIPSTTSRRRGTGRVWFTSNHRAGIGHLVPDSGGRVVCRDATGSSAGRLEQRPIAG